LLWQFFLRVTLYSIMLEYISVKTLRLSIAMTFSKKKHLLKLVFIFLATLMPVNVYAQFEEEEDPNEVKWERFESVTNIFTTKFPQKYKYKVFPFRFNEDTIAFSGEIASTLDGQDKTNEKSILIRVMQTFGDPISKKEVKKILDKEAKKYIESIRSTGGTVLTNEDFVYNGFSAKRLYITYKEKGEKFGMRMNIFLTDYSKIEQVLSGPAKSMYSYRSDDFFSSIKLYDGITRSEKTAPFARGWKSVTSKNNVFTVKLPPKNPDYTPISPTLKASKKKEYLFFEFTDPVRDESLFYSVYSYKLGKAATYELSKNILFSSHITKFVKNASIDHLKTENSFIDGVNVMSTKLVVPSPAKFPYIDTILLEARYKNDTVVVQEIMTTAGHARVGLPKNLMASLKFHPEKYKYTPRKKKSKKKKNDDAKK